MKLLHIDSSVLGPHSVSRQVSAAIVDRLRKATPGLEIVYRDLTSTPLAHLSGPHLSAAQGAVPEAALQQDLAAGQAVMDEFLAADIVVLGAPMYNFTIPSQLKAWIDRIVVAGKTFKARKDWPATSESLSRSRAADSTAPARRRQWASIWKPICAGCSDSSASKTPNLFRPMESRSGRNTARRRRQTPCKLQPTCTRRKKR
jgi:putative NADPH-quinone reductase